MKLNTLMCREVILLALLATTALAVKTPVSDELWSLKGAHDAHESGKKCKYKIAKLQRRSGITNIDGEIRKRTINQLISLGFRSRYCFIDPDYIIYGTRHNKKTEFLVTGTMELAHFSFKMKQDKTKREETRFLVVKETGKAKLMEICTVDYAIIEFLKGNTKTTGVEREKEFETIRLQNQKLRNDLNRVLERGPRWQTHDEAREEMRRAVSTSRGTGFVSVEGAQPEMEFPAPASLTESRLSKRPEDVGHSNGDIPRTLSAPMFVPPNGRGVPCESTPRFKWTKGDTIKLRSYARLYPVRASTLLSYDKSFQNFATGETFIFEKEVDEHNVTGWSRGRLFKINKYYLEKN